MYYGADGNQPSFERVRWQMRPGLRPDRNTPPTVASVPGMTRAQVRMDGSTPEYVGGATEFPMYPMPMGAPARPIETSYWELHSEMQDGSGDGTVPISSGAAPKRDGGPSVKQQFRLSGFGHAGSYKDARAQNATLYAICKIAGVAKRSA